MEFEIGAILDGKVTGITKFGAFVALPGGRSGLVHISEVAYSYVSDVSEFLSVGQDVQVKVISVDGSNRINLSIKQTQPAPQRPERGGRRFQDRRPQQGGERPPRERSDHGERSRSPRSERPKNREPVHTAPKETSSFEDMMKRYMSESESRQSQLNRGSRGSRRGRSRGSRSGGNSRYDDF